MTNEEAAKILTIFKEINDNLHPKIVFDAIDMAISALKSQRWIPVTERMPAYNEDVLLFFEDDEMSVGCAFQYNKADTWFVKKDDGYWYFAASDPTHWMPLPPKEEIT